MNKKIKFKKNYEITINNINKQRLQKFTKAQKLTVHLNSLFVIDVSYCCIGSLTSKPGSAFPKEQHVQQRSEMKTSMLWGFKHIAYVFKYIYRIYIFF